ncbi:MAG: 1-acyl-sn-glycerol-3-phosphate acyltransferase [Thermodesulfovibrionales bacterium]|nr:1-acyl-sn-glycerol-3-phosphate acyltransferase [Thermodesulfovibrionales bacterium]
MITEDLMLKDNIYETETKKIPLIAKLFPSGVFYSKILFHAVRIGLIAKKSKFNYERMYESSLAVIRALEGVGGKFRITGLENFKEFDTPCVVIANHMSSLETLALSAIILPYKKVTFILKEELLRYPLFRHALIAAEVIPVGRKNPRQDLKSVIENGIDRIKRGISIVVFPQTTRYLDFKVESFNTIGIKLAKKANVPVIPLALKTDAWGIGKFLKDFGKIDTSKEVYFSFGEPLWVKGAGNEEHFKVVEYIREKLMQWKKLDQT